VRQFFLLCSLLALGACGYIGDTQPPSLRIPLRIADVSALQKGAELIIRFTLPTRTTDNAALKSIAGLDLRIGPAGADGESGGMAVQAKGEPGQAMELRISVERLAGNEMQVRVRSAGRPGRYSEWSEALLLSIAAAPDAPRDLRATANKQGTLLEWEGPADMQWRIRRKASKDAEYGEAVEVSAPRWQDPAQQAGVPVVYEVTGLRKGKSSTAESVDVAQGSITWEDRFAPEAPTGLSAIAAPGSVELTWSPLAESDLARYRIYRAEAADWKLLAEGTATPVYSDRTARSGQVLRYRVTAIDQKGNESAPSAPTEMQLP
jgi:hypothetical protein